MKFFNTAGPVNQDDHYKLDPIHRWDFDEILMLLAQRKYFLLHAPRQTGKTSSLLALQAHLNAGEDYTAIYANFECGQAARNDTRRAMGALIEQLKLRCEQIMGEREQLNAIQQEAMAGDKPDIALNSFLPQLCRLSKKPIVLLLDEVDSLIGDTLVSVLRQLRAGYDSRPGSFPQSTILCGVVDIKDYKIHRSDGEIITGGSCFNIKSKSLRLGNFSRDEISQHYLAHTRETGQVFSEGLFDLAWDYTAGQPWLVNALAYEACFEMKENRDRSVPITAAIFRAARERLIRSRATHLDQLADKLKEERVYRVIQPMVSGTDSELIAEDVQYCTDLGLIRESPEGLVLANDIYREVLPRELTESLQNRFLTRFAPAWVDPDGSINTDRLLTMFQQFWRENSEIWKPTIAGYLEAAPHLVFQGFLQRVANGEGLIDREYGLGRGRADLFLRWQAATAAEQRIVFELKMRTERESSASKMEMLLGDGLAQTARYADQCGAHSAHLIIFDRRDDISWEEKIYRHTHEQAGRPITVWGM
jgi:hypothetical protein